MKDADSVRSLQQQHVQQFSCTLDECFQLYTKEEQVLLHSRYRKCSDAETFLHCSIYILIVLIYKNILFVVHFGLENRMWHEDHLFNGNRTRVKGGERYRKG